MDTEVLVVGAGPAGLAVAATLKSKGRRPLVIEKSTQVGASWRNHYERLHLHTVKALSALPGLPFPDEAPRYVPRQGVVDYLVAYAAQAGIEPCFGEEATAIVRDAAGRWRTSTRSGAHLRCRRRRRHHRREQPSGRADDRRRGALPPRRADRPQPRLPRRSAVRGRARPRRRHGQHRRRDRPRSRRARRRRRAFGSLARQHRPSRRPRPADPADLDHAGAPADAGRRRAGAPAVRRHGRRHRPLRACRARASRRCASCASRAGRR